MQNHPSQKSPARCAILHHLQTLPNKSRKNSTQNFPAIFFFPKKSKLKILFAYKLNINILTFQSFNLKSGSMKKTPLVTVLIFILCFGLTGRARAEGQAYGMEASCCECSPIYVHPARLYMGGIVGKGLGCDNKRYATAGLFYAPFFNGQGFQPFLDVRGHYLKNNRWAANAGLGLRYLDCCNSRVWGANVFYDYRKICLGPFNQIGVGLESLGTFWDVRANGYFPNKKRSKTQLFNHFIGDFFAICRRWEFGLTGADAEAGAHLYRCGPFDLYTGLGGYYYRRHERCKNLWGGMARLKMLYTEYTSVEVVATFDQVYHTKVQGIFTISLPFEVLTKACHLATNYCQSLLLQPVIRNEIITVDRKCGWRSNF